MSGWISISRTIITPLIVLMLAAMMVSPAYSAAVPSLYAGEIANCEAPGLENLFSGFVCKYQEIVDEVLSNLYFQMLEFFKQPFAAIMTLFVIMTGTVFAVGIMPFTTRDIMIALAKIAIISGFAMYPSLTIDLFYRGVIGFMRQTTDTVVSVLSPIDSVPGIFEWMDQRLYEFLKEQDSAERDKNCDRNILALMFGLAVTMPPIFAIIMYILVQLVMVFVRTVFAYLMAITGIMFLTTLAPLFLSFAFFRFSSSYFEKWLSYILSFAMQIFVVFSFIGIVLSLPFEQKLSAIGDTVQPYNKVAYHDGQRLNFNNWCTLCKPKADGDLTTPDICVGDPITPTNIQVGGTAEFIDWIGQEIVILAVMAYVMTTVLKLAPSVARYVTGVTHAPVLGNARLPMEDQIGPAGTSLFRSFRDGQVHRNAGRAVSNAFSQLVGNR